MPSKKERDFERKVKRLIEKADSLQEQEVKKAIRLLAEARREVAAAVASTEWQAYHLPQLKAAIDRALARFADQYGIELREMQRDFWEQGIDLVDLPMRTIGVVVAVPEIDATALAILQDYSSDLVKGLKDDAVKKINQEITMGIMGQKQPYEVMQQVGLNLTDKSIFKSIADRAEAITRTESGSVLNMASQARLNSAAQMIPGLEKEWRHSHVSRQPRPSHLALDGTHIPVDEDFLVGGIPMAYPHDPRGGAKNNVRCACYVVPYHARWEAVSTRLAA